MTVVVLTLDQRDSRSGPDLVPTTAAALAGIPTLRAFERTAGDEMQGVLDSAASVIAVLARLVRAGAWNIGVGIGPVDRPLPAQARAGRGQAYLHARDAVTAAKQSPTRLSVVGADHYRAEQLETVLWLWADLLGRRSTRGWEVVDLARAGLSYVETADRLGISQSAVSQRAKAAGLVESARAELLAEQLLDEQLLGRQRAPGSGTDTE